jgi:hypothetical protein
MKMYGVSTLALVGFVRAVDTLQESEGCSSQEYYILVLFFF